MFIERLKASRLARAIRKRNLTYLQPQALQDLYFAAREIEKTRVPGRIIEAGTALGGSAVVLATAKHPSRPMELYDTFGMIPPPGDKDGEDVHRRYETIVSGKSRGIGGEQYYGYRGDLRDQVAATLRSFGRDPDAHSIQLTRGLYQDTFHPEDPIAMAHVDCDWYESVHCILERLWPVLSPGGIVVIDDYHAWSGCRTATDEFIAAHAGELEVRQRSRPHLVKNRERAPN